MKLHRLLIVYAILAILVLAVSSQEVEDEKEFSYVSGSETGPERWGKIHKEWSNCSAGKMQSPIDLRDERVQVFNHLGVLRQAYKPADAIMKNRGHDILVKWNNGAGGMWLDGTEYVLKQLHWHSPSEHTINGKRFCLELHMVHESSDGKVAVVGILYTIGRPDCFREKMEKYIRKLKDMDESEEKIGMVDPSEIKKGSRNYYRYMGSLTTPPCTEGVTWTIINRVRTACKAQVNLLRAAVEDNMGMNARPIQQINGRVIGLYRPKKTEHLTHEIQ